VKNNEGMFIGMRPKTKDGNLIMRIIEYIYDMYFLGLTPGSIITIEKTLYPFDNKVLWRLKTKNTHGMTFLLRQFSKSFCVIHVLSNYFEENWSCR